MKISDETRMLILIIIVILFAMYSGIFYGCSSAGCDGLILWQGDIFKVPCEDVQIVLDSLANIAELDTIYYYGDGRN